MRTIILKSEDEFNAFAYAHTPRRFKPPKAYPVQINIIGYNYSYIYPDDGLVWLNRLKELHNPTVDGTK